MYKIFLNFTLYIPSNFVPKDKRQILWWNENNQKLRNRIIKNNEKIGSKHLKDVIEKTNQIYKHVLR